MLTQEPCGNHGNRPFENETGVFVFVLLCCHVGSHLFNSNCSYLIMELATWLICLIGSTASQNIPAAISFLYSGHVLTQPCHMTYSGHVLTQPCHMTYSGHVLTQPCHMTYSGHVLTQPRHMSYSGHVLTQPCHMTSEMNQSSTIHLGRILFGVRWRHSVPPVQYLWGIVKADGGLVVIPQW